MHNVILVPEQHYWDRNISSVSNYLEQQDLIRSHLVRIIGGIDSPIVIHIGDIFHREFKNFRSGMEAFEYFHWLDEVTHHRTYSVIGNHELTYSANNPFWMMSEIHSEWAQGHIMAPQNQMISKFMQVVDCLELDDILFVFGHYGRSLQDAKVPANVKSVIPLIHGNVITSEILGILTEKYSRDISDEYGEFRSFRDPGVLPASPKVSDVFVGHMHTAYGKFTVDEFMNGIQYNFGIKFLGSLGRTASNQYNDKDLIRSVYCIHTGLNTERGYDIEEFNITLPSRAECINESTVLAKQIQYKQAKKLKAIGDIAYNPLDVIGSIKSQYQDDPQILELFDCALESNRPNFLSDT